MDDSQLSTLNPQLLPTQLDVNRYFLTEHTLFRFTHQRPSAVRSSSGDRHSPMDRLAVPWLVSTGCTSLGEVCVAEGRFFVGGSRVEVDREINPKSEGNSHFKVINEMKSIPFQLFDMSISFGFRILNFEFPPLSPIRTIPMEAFCQDPAVEPPQNDDPDDF
jgi:hypothetical protein